MRVAWGCTLCTASNSGLTVHQILLVCGAHSTVSAHQSYRGCAHQLLHFSNACCRVLALKLLCEIRLDKDDLRSAIELSMKPVKPPSRPPSGKTRAGGSSTRGRPEPSPEPTMDFRHEPLGEDAHSVMYWYLDLGPEGHTSLTGNAFKI